jgi:drug/metabolite transporter (DMT)-like permease
MIPRDNVNSVKLFSPEIRIITMQIPYLGEIFAFVTAIVWASAVILFKKSGETVHPVALNFFKNLLAMVLLIPTIYLFDGWFFEGFTRDEIILLLVSGALGIGIADTLFFKSLNLLGAGLSAIVDCLYSPSIIFLAFIWVGERLGTIQIIGVVMIISAVLTITRADKSGHINRRNLLLGILWGALAMFTMAIGIVMIKPLLNRSPLLPLSEIRLIGGGLILAVVFLFHPQRKTIATPHLTRRGWTYLLIGSFLGAYCALLLWLAGMKYTQASIAAALNQTSNIFIFIFAALFLKEPITRRKVVGIILGVAGAFIVTFG